MALKIEVPSPLAEDLSAEAEREGVSATDQATFLLQLMTTLTRQGRETPFRHAIRSYLRENSLDWERLAEVFEGLKSLCLQNPHPSPNSTGPIDRNRDLGLLREWRNAAVHRPTGEGKTPEETEISGPSQLNRVSSRGKYAYLNFGTEEFMAEKQREIDLEDRAR